MGGGLFGNKPSGSLFGGGNPGMTPPPAPTSGGVFGGGMGGQQT